MNERYWVEGNDDIEQEAQQRRASENPVDHESVADSWHAPFLRIDMDGSRQQDVRVEPVFIYEGVDSASSSLSILFSERLSEQEFTERLRTIASKIEEGGFAAIRA